MDGGNTAGRVDCPVSQFGLNNLRHLHVRHLEISVSRYLQSALMFTSISKVIGYTSSHCLHDQATLQRVVVNCVCAPP